jgi:hypothetical protein
VVIGVQILASSNNEPVDDTIEMPLKDTNQGKLEDAVVSQTGQFTVPLDASISTDDSGSSLPVGTLESSAPEGTLRRSSVRALRGILKKPRKYSKDAKFPERQDVIHQPKEPNRLNSTADSVVPEVSSQHSDETPTIPDASLESQPTKTEATDLSPYKMHRGSLHMAAFDRVLFAKRGAELRNEYLRDFQ